MDDRPPNRGLEATAGPTLRRPTSALARARALAALGLAASAAAHANCQAQTLELNLWLPAHPNEVRRDAALNARCRIRATLGIELEKALDDCSDAVDGSRRSPAYLDSRGWIYLRLGEYRKALSDFDRSVEVRSESAWTRYGRAPAKARLGEAAQGEANLAAAGKVQHDIDQQAARVGLPTMEGAAKP